MKEQTRAAPESSGGLSSLVGRLLGAFEHSLSPGDVAALRRLRTDEVPPAAFYRLASGILEPQGSLPLDGPGRDERLERWTIILSAMARLRGLHRPSRSMGAALADAGYHELRFERLLRANPAALGEQVRGASLYLAASGAAFNQVELAALVLTTDPQRATKLRRALARDYHRTLSTKANKS